MEMMLGHHYDDERWSPGPAPVPGTCWAVDCADCANGPSSNGILVASSASASAVQALSTLGPLDLAHEQAGLAHLYAARGQAAQAPVYADCEPPGDAPGEIFSYASGEDRDEDCGETEAAGEASLAAMAKARPPLPSLFARPSAPVTSTATGAVATSHDGIWRGGWSTL